MPVRLKENEMGARDLDVGIRIRAFRKRNNLSLNELSKLTGIAASTLSSMELNKSSPTLATLLKIAAAFDMTAGALLDQVLHTKAAVFRKDEARSVETPGPGITEFDITGNIYRGMLSATLIALEAGAETFSLDAAAGDRFVYCLEGVVVALVDSDSIELAAGDSLFVSAGARLAVESRAQSTAKLLMVTAIPAVAAG